jgi:hypothetical protein
LCTCAMGTGTIITGTIMMAMMIIIITTAMRAAAWRMGGIMTGM